MIKPYENNNLTNFITQLKNTPVNYATFVYTCFNLIIDLSGSMMSNLSLVKAMITSIYDELTSVSKHNFVLNLVVIYNSIPHQVFIGNIKKFPCNDFISSIDNASGLTPLADAWAILDESNNRITETLEHINAWYTIPVFLSITDCMSTEDDSNIKRIIEKFRNDITNNKKFVCEFTTTEGGMNLGGYKVLIDSPDSVQDIRDFMRTFKRASTTVPMSLGAPPHKNDRIAYNIYRSSAMVTEFRTLWEKRNGGEMK